MIPKACKKYCMNFRKCPEPMAMQFIEQLEQAQHILLPKELSSICFGFMQDPTDNEEFTITIWGV
jgi:hypothetical protein